jgi:L-2,4-diaminobutyrate decarboxylase
MEGIGEDDALDMIAAAALDGAAQLGHPGFFAHMDPPTPWITWITAMWNAAANPNLLHEDTGAAARAVEGRVVEWLAPHFGMDGGHVVPGSTMANLTALWAAREVAGVTRVVASAHAHISVPKSAAILGLAYEPAPPRPDHTLETEGLADLSDAAVVVTAGTTATGAIDPLAAAPEAGWRHVDAAWAGPLRLTQRYAYLFDGIEHADSVAVSAHKWLYQPKESALVLFADSAPAHEALSFGGAYLAVPNVGVLGSHGAAGISLAATLLAWGWQGLAERIEGDMAKADRLCELINADDRFELWGPNQTGVVAWRPRRGDVRAVRDAMEGAFVSVTSIDGADWLRSVAVNPGADPDRVMDAAVAALERLP